ncbi:tyrosine-type recombinase/integrase [Streptosporangium algeriense]|uniref:Tyrosine-type recombinase/integrase n=1 Tax=Streptosporangium algeriense TaxID=1682748 RepID=A0ABW3DJG6_9ACTN
MDDATSHGLTKRPRIHDLRHTHVAWLISDNTPMAAVQRRMGHTSITTTIDRYGHLLPYVDQDLMDSSGLATPALNAAEPAAQGLYGKAAFDAVGPLLLTGWPAVGPYLLSGLQETPTLAFTGSPRNAHGLSPDPDQPLPTSSTTPLSASGTSLNGRSTSRGRSRPLPSLLLRKSPLSYSAPRR